MNVPAGQHVGAVAPVSAGGFWALVFYVESACSPCVCVGFLRDVLLVPKA